MKPKCSLKGKDNKVCYPDESLRQFIIKILKQEPSQDIDLNIDTISKYMKEKYGCLEYSCWKDYSTIFKKEYFLPDARWTEKNRLISNIDVFNIMQQYMNFYNDFQYLGDYNHDLYKKKGEFIKKLDEAKENVNKKIFFILISLWGEKLKLFRHWVCILIDKVAREVFFYDSTINPQSLIEIAPVIDLIGKHMNIHKFTFSKVKTQFDYEHCGLFCIHIISYILKNQVDNPTKSIHKLYGEALNDLYEKKNKLGFQQYYDYVNSLRQKYFVNSK